MVFRSKQVGRELQEVCWIWLV